MVEMQSSLNWLGIVQGQFTGTAAYFYVIQNQWSIYLRFVVIPYINISFLMSGFLSLIEVAMAGGLLAENIATEVMKKQLKDIIDAHQDQFNMMKEMNDIIDQLIDEQSLSSQLSTSNLFSVKNWAFINENIEKKREIAKTIIDSFKDINSTAYQFTTMGGIQLGLGAVFAVYMLYTFFGGKQPGFLELKANVKTVMEFTQNKFKTSINQVVRRATGEVEIVSMENRPLTEEIMSQARNPRVSQAMKSTTMDKFVEAVKGGVRLIFVGLMIWGFVEGVKGLNQLKQSIDKYKKYFDDQGQFQKMEQGLIVVMTTLSSDIFNLLNASRAMLNEVRSILLLNSFLIPQQREKFVAESDKFIDTKLGLTQDVIAASRKLFESVKDVKYQGNDKNGYIKAFTTILDNYRPYMKEHNPKPLLNSIAKHLTTEIALLDLSSDFIFKNQKVINDFTGELGKTMTKRKADIQNINPANPPDNLKISKIDYKCEVNIFNNYKYRLFSLNNMGSDLPQDIQNLGKNDQQILIAFLATYTDTFYADDETGNSLFGLKFTDYKSTSTNENDITLVLNHANIITIPNKSEEKDETEARKPYIDGIQKLKPQYFDQTKFTTRALYRFMRLELKPQSLVVNDKKYDTIVCYEGLLFESQNKVSKEVTHFGSQRDLYNQVISFLELPF